MPGEFPLFDGFAKSELQAVQGANLPHLCTVEVVDSDGAWTAAANNVACRLMHVSAAIRFAGDQHLRPDTEWLLAFAASSPHAGPRRRYIVSGNRPDGTAFVTRTLYSQGAHVPHVEESVAVVECTESPSAPGS